MLLNYFIVDCKELHLKKSSHNFIIIFEVINTKLNQIIYFTVSKEFIIFLKIMIMIIIHFHIIIYIFIHFKMLIK